METWRKVWRDGLAPVLSTKGLLALGDALAKNDVRLTQCAVTAPPPMQWVLDWPVEGACVVVYCAWQGDRLETVGEVEEFFARTCFEADTRLGEPAAVRYFINWFDDTPRDEMRRLLLEEVERVLVERNGEVVTHDGPGRPVISPTPARRPAPPRPDRGGGRRRQAPG